MKKEQLSSLFDTILMIVWGIFFLTLPFVMSTATTDAFLLPKEILLTVVVLLSLLLWGGKMILHEAVTFRRTPFDLPVLLFMLATLLSALFAVNRADSIIATVPLLIAGCGYFVLVNSLRKENTIIYMLSALLVGGAAIAILSIFSFFKVYPLLFSFTHFQAFTPIGSLVEQAFYFSFLLPIALFFALPLLKGRVNNRTVTFAVVTGILGAGLLVTLGQLFTTQKPLFLPFETGFQTAFAAISQDAGRIAEGFLFGSGYGNFAAVLTRFKQATFNTNPLWATQFTNSSSFILEILATTGVFGMLSFLFLLFRAVVHPSEKRKNPVYLALLVIAVISLILPYSLFEIALLFLLLGLFSAVQAVRDTNGYYDVEFKFVALKKGVISLQQVSLPSHEKHEFNRPTAIVVGVVLLLIVGVVGWFGSAFVLSDIIFQQSLVLAASNNGTGTYKDQADAITTFPYRSVYYRVFSQTNIALAGSLASIQKGGSPSAQTQNTLYSLIQQGITTAKTATTLSPQSVANWQNLSSVYRSLIGVGQNADSFAILAAQQAIVLDSANPQEYLALGGIYYQLGQWDNAIRAFQQSIALKQDYANAYYNLAHSYEQKADYQDAMTAFQAVQQLVGNDKTNLATVTADIQALQDKMGQQGPSSPTPTPTPVKKETVSGPTQAPLNLSGKTTPAGEAASPVPSTVPSPAPIQ